MRPIGCAQAHRFNLPYLASILVYPVQRCVFLSRSFGRAQLRALSRR